MDIDRPAAPAARPELLAVLIAGFGTDLVPLTSDNGDEPCPKALLPVANKPLLEYVLSWIEQAGIMDVLLICPEIHRPALHHHINSDISSSSLRVDIQTVDETSESTLGTCHILRQFASRITEDFVLVPCDLITPPTLPLSTLLNQFRIEAASHDAIVSTCWYPAYTPEKGTLDEWGPVPSHPSIVWDPITESLLHVDTPDDHDKNAEDLQVKMDLLSRYPRTKLSASFQDSHVYVCQRKVLGLLAAKPRFESFKSDFIPWLVKLQYQPRKQRKYTEILKETQGKEKPYYVAQTLALQHSSVSNPDDALDILQLNNEGDSPLTPTFKVSLHIHSPNTGLALRINNLYTFLEINRSFLSSTTYALPVDPKSRSLIDQKVQISSDTMIGDSTSIAERTIIKRSVIGRHCIIGKHVKIIGCILFDHCVVEDGAKLDGCILGKNTKIGGKAELTRCITGGGYEANAGEQLKGEKLDVSDWTAGGGAALSTDEDDGSSEADSE